MGCSCVGPNHVLFLLLCRKCIWHNLCVSSCFVSVNWLFVIYIHLLADPVNSSLNFETSAQTSFSDGEDEKKIPYHQQQRGGVRSKTSIIRSSLATEERKVTPNNTGFAPLDWTNDIGKYLILLLVVLGVLAAFALRPLILKKQDAHKVDEVQVMKKFYDGFRKLQINFPSQSQALWSRSQRILELHLLNKDNKQPAIILLTAAQDAEQTLHCVGNKLAKTYASSLNSNYTVISGPDRKSEDSEDVKEEIDDKLSEGFQGTARAAVLHRLELLPPGSLLILYKYCDHENANFKNVALVLTVLLDDSTLTTDILLSDLEEKVRDFFGKTFIVSDTKKSHNEMDVDKLSGVWSRISHVVLPVFPEKDVGKQCEETETKV
ncbi:torsin-1A-interacting protein 1-like [Pseudophryne corroboree]|uniref:torsin-1A-interacting protein 1-like n=1 Tax=Pseudophryne corroboree TaxID=495146 RepID=UPI00308155A5